MPDYRLAARRAAQKYGVDPGIFLRQISAESGFNPSARSPKGAQGIAQFIPSTAKQYGVNLGDNRASDDLDGAARLMRDLLQQNGGNYHRALSAYNSGRPEGYKSIAETRNYVAKILNGTGGTSQRGSASSDGPSTRTVSRTIPGVDRSEQRRMVRSAYLQQRGRPDALLELAAGLKGAQDTPSRTVTSTVRGSTGGGAGSRRFDVKELFWQGQNGIDVKDGQVEPQGFVSGHTDHVHVASGPRQILAIARIAEEMGLHVGENPAFGGVDPVHATHSYHYRIKVVNGRKVGEAIDVSGDPRKMAAFAHRIARLRK